MKTLIVLFHDWLIRSSGTLLMWVGLITILLNLKFDRIAGRAPLDWCFGPMQKVGFGVSIMLIYWGATIYRAYKDWDRDISE